MNVKTKKNNILLVFVAFVSAITLYSCREDNYIPKPRSFHRIDLPPQDYQSFRGDCQFTFEYPTYSKVLDKQSNCNQIIVFPYFKASIYVTYKDITNEDKKEVFETVRQLAYEHRVKAQSINETRFDNDSSHVHGILYEINGNVASNIQFFLTDSVHHLYRGALYFEAVPNYDSLRPAIDFLKEDIIHLCETFKFTH